MVATLTTAVVGMMLIAFAALAWRFTDPTADTSDSCPCLWSTPEGPLTPVAARQVLQYHHSCGSRCPARQHAVHELIAAGQLQPDQRTED